MNLGCLQCGPVFLIEKQDSIFIYDERLSVHSKFERKTRDIHKFKGNYVLFSD